MLAHRSTTDYSLCSFSALSPVLSVWSISKRRVRDCYTCVSIVASLKVAERGVLLERRQCRNNGTIYGSERRWTEMVWVGVYQSHTVFISREQRRDRVQRLRYAEGEKTGRIQCNDVVPEELTVQ